MSIGHWFFGIGAVLFIYLFFLNKKHKLYNVVLILTIFSFLGGVFLPKELLGKWNAVKFLKGRDVNHILLSPSEPDWEVNLTDTLVTILNKSEVDHIINLLKETDIYIPSHPIRIWETKMILVTADRDSFSLRIHKTTDDGTIIYSPNNELRRDELSTYLEKVTNFVKPLKLKRN